MNEWILIIAPVAFIVIAGATLYLRDWMRRARVKRQMKEREARRKSKTFLESQKRRHRPVPLSQLDRTGEDRFRE